VDRLANSKLFLSLNSVETGGSKPALHFKDIKVNKLSQNWNKLSAAAAVAMASVSTGAFAVSDLPGGPAVRQLNLHLPATKLAEDIAYLHWFMMAICLAIFVAVFGVMFYSIFKHRKSQGHKPAHFHESIKVEIAWTVVPFIIVIFMAIPATKTVIAQKDTSNADLTIKATGYQWRWGYDYIKGEGEGISFISSLDNEHRIMSNSGVTNAAPDDYLLKVDNPLVVPVGKKIRIITTSSDVIHSFAMPSFGIKQDAIPGFVRDTHFRAERTGDFYGQCQELCGKEHAYMPIHVKVLSDADYAAWVKSKKSDAPAAEVKQASAPASEQIAQAAVPVKN
jgi:cytochrome c oxidase subunit 2